jgi:hypothetical protein
MMGPSQLARDEPGDDEDYATLVRKLILAKPERLILDEGALVVMKDIRQSLHKFEATSDGQRAPGDGADCPRILEG